MNLGRLWLRVGVCGLVSLFMACTAAGPAQPSTPAGPARTFGFDTLRELRRDGNIDVAGEPQAVALTPFTLLWDETGKAEGGILNQPLTDRLWARKDFVLDRTEARWAQVYFIAGSEKTTVTFNGQRLKVGPAKDWAYGNWGVVDVPVEALRRGTNTFTFSGAGEIYVENNRSHQRSARSLDGGKTWDYDYLGAQGQFNGEYLVRFGLGRYPEQGVIWSDGIDLAAVAGGTGDGQIAPRAAVRSVTLTADTDTPAGTAVVLELRSGTTLEDDPATWAPWEIAAPSSAPGSAVAIPPGHRFAQWRATLKTTNPLRTPRLRSVTLRPAADAEPSPDAGKIRVIDMKNARIVRGSYPFHDQAPSQRLALLRQKYGLDKVVTGKATELERFIALRDWTRHQWKNGWTNGEYFYCTPLDALLILDLAGRGKGAAFCGHYAAVFVQAALALGYNARIIDARGHSYAEVWSNDAGRWLLMDVGPAVDDKEALNYHYTAGGVVLNSLDMHRRLLSGDWGGVDVVTSTPQSAWRIADHPEAMQRYQYTGIQLRNNHLDTLIPGDLDENGWPTDTDWLFWRDGAVAAQRRDNPHTTSREGDFYWTLNQAAIYPAFGAAPGSLRLDLDTNTPNLKTFERRVDGAAWKDCPRGVDWALHAGRNSVEVRTVNLFGMAGPVSTMTVEYAP